jgi:hypothetical protein
MIACLALGLFMRMVMPFAVPLVSVEPGMMTAWSSTRALAPTAAQTSLRYDSLDYADPLEAHT